MKSRRPVSELIGALCGLLLAAEAHATTRPIAEMSEEELLAKVEVIGDLRAADPALICPSVPYAEELARRRDEPKIRGAARMLAGLCHLTGDRADEALRELEIAEGYFDDAEYGSNPELEQIILWAAYLAGQWDKFADHAEHVARRDQPGEFKSLEYELMSGPRYGGERKATSRWALAFARGRSFGSLSPRVQQLVADSAVRPALEAGDLALAGRMIDFLHQPSAAAAMLQDRQFAALWSKLEARIGEGQRKIIGDQLSAARKQAAADANDKEARVALAGALQFAGRHRDVVRLAEGINIGKADEQDGWLLNLASYSYDELGQRAKGDEFFDGLAALDPDTGERSWLVNFVINRTARLASQGRWAEAGSAAERAVAVAEKHGSDYAQQVSAGYLYCTKSRMGQLAEAAGKVSVLETDWKHAPAATARAALCLGDQAAAVRIIAAALADSEKRDAIVEELQPPQADYYGKAPSAFPELHDFILTQPALLQQFNAVARFLPARFYPTAL